jgi:hypothetical protein
MGGRRGSWKLWLRGWNLFLRREGGEGVCGEDAEQGEEGGCNGRGGLMFAGVFIVWLLGAGSRFIPH